MNIRDLLEVNLVSSDLDAIQAVIVKTPKGYSVKSHDRTKHLGGPYRSKKQAAERLRQVEYFKNK